MATDDVSGAVARIVNRITGAVRPMVQVAEKLSRHQLQPETESWRKKNLLIVRDRKPNQIGTYLFFQILNHRSPEGIFKVYIN
jgi:hypothetical protein